MPERERRGGRAQEPTGEVRVLCRRRRHFRGEDPLIQLLNEGLNGVKHEQIEG